MDSVVIPPDAPRPRLCHIVKRPDFMGYGFNLHAEKARPGQFIGKVDENSPAEEAGLKEGDRIIEVNLVNITQENHKQVVQRIKAVANETRLLVVDKPTDEYYKKAGIVVKSSLPNVLEQRSAEVNDNFVSTTTTTTAATIVSSLNEKNQEESEDANNTAASPTRSHSSIEKESLPTPPPPYPEEEEEDDKKPIFRPNTIDAEVVVEIQPRVYDNEEPDHEITTSSPEPPTYSEEPPLKPSILETEAPKIQVTVEVEEENREAEELEDSLEIPTTTENDDEDDEEEENKENKVDINENQEKNQEEVVVAEKKSSIVLPPTEKQMSVSSDDGSSSQRTTPSPTTVLERSDSDRTDWDGLNLSLSAREMRERIVSKKKSDPRREKLDMRKKFEIIQTL